MRAWQKPQSWKDELIDGEKWDVYIILYYEDKVMPLCFFGKLEIQHRLQIKYVWEALEEYYC